MRQKYPFGHSHTNLESPSKRPTDYFLIMVAFVAVVSTLLAIGILSAYLVTTLVSLPWADYLPGIRALPSDRQFLTTGAALLFIALVFLILFRQRLRGNQTYQFVNGCPSCHHHDLIRVHRQQYQRLIAQVLRIPLRSYACRNCSWQGVLVYGDPQKLSKVPLPATSMKEEAGAQKGGGPAAVEKSVADRGSNLSIDRENGMAEAQEGGELGDKDEEVDGDEKDSWPGKPEEVKRAGQERQGVVASPKVEPLSPRRESSATATEENSIDPAADTPVSAEVDEIVAPSEVEIEEAGKVGEEKRPAEGEIVADEIEKVRPLADPPLDQRSVAMGEEAVVRAIIVAPFGLSLRSAPDSRANIIRSLPPDAVVEVLDLETTDSPVNWRHVRFEGQAGWAAAAFLRYLQS